MLASLRSPRDVRAGESPRWLLSRGADFWLVGGGGVLVLMALARVWHGDGELDFDFADLLLSEVHLGATYDAIARRGLWRRMPLDVFVVPLAILGATYAVALHDGWVLLVKAILYVGAWHRGRQSLAGSYAVVDLADRTPQAHPEVGGIA